MPGEDVALRECIARALWAFAYADLPYDEPFPEEGDDHTHALLSADAVLDAIGLEQVGRQCSRHGQGCHSRCSEPMEPIYRVRLSGSSET